MSLVKPTLQRSRARIGVLITALALGCTACATIQTPDGRQLPLASDEFRDYAQDVFRRQNETLNSLMFVLPELELEAPGRYADALDAEARLLTACEELNDLAAGYRDGRSPGLGRRWSAARSVVDCDRADAQVRAVLSAEPESVSE